MADILDGHCQRGKTIHMPRPHLIKKELLLSSIALCTILDLEGSDTGALAGLI